MNQPYLTMSDFSMADYQRPASSERLFNEYIDGEQEFGKLPNALTALKRKWDEVYLKNRVASGLYTSELSTIIRQKRAETGPTDSADSASSTSVDKRAAATAASTSFSSSSVQSGPSKVLFAMCHDPSIQLYHIFIMLVRGAEPSTYVDVQTGSTCLHQLSRCCSYKALFFLSSLSSIKLDFDALDFKGRSLLMEACDAMPSFAISSRQLKTVQLLLSSTTIPVDHRDNNGESALSWALRTNNVQIVKELLCSNASVSYLFQDSISTISSSSSSNSSSEKKPKGHSGSSKSMKNSKGTAPEKQQQHDDEREEHKSSEFVQTIVEAERARARKNHLIVAQELSALKNTPETRIDFTGSALSISSIRLLQVLKFKPERSRDICCGMLLWRKRKEDIDNGLLKDVKAANKTRYDLDGQMQQHRYTTAMAAAATASGVKTVVAPPMASTTAERNERKQEKLKVRAEQKEREKRDYWAKRQEEHIKRLGSQFNVSAAGIFQTKRYEDTTGDSRQPYSKFTSDLAK